MKKIFCIIFSLIVMLSSVSGEVSAEDNAMNAELTIITDPMALNLSEAGEFTVSYTIDNKSLTDRINATAEYTLIDEDENLLWSDWSDITVSGGGMKNFVFKGTLSKYGVHTLKILVKDKKTGAILKGETAISLSKSNLNLNKSAGVSSHFAWNSNPNSTIPYLRKMGSAFVRDEIYMEACLNENGEYIIPEKSDDYINKLVENGLEPIVILNHSINSNSVIPFDSAEFENFVEEFGAYVYFLVNELKGRVKYFEVWNEMNTVNNGSYGRQYALLLKTAYKQAKLANPECKIIGPVTAGTSRTFFTGMKTAVADIADYMDILSFHEYAYKNIPEAAEYEKTLNKCTETLKSYFGTNKEIWLTEMGWAEGYEDITEREAAMYTVRQYLNNSYKKFADKMFVYTWINHQNHQSQYEANLGLLNGNLSAKKGYVAMSAMNCFINGYNLKERKTDSEGNYIYSYKKAEDEEVIVLFNINDTVKTVKVGPEAESMIIYDMYGNKIGKLSGEEVYNISIDGAPKYLVSERAAAKMDYTTNTAVLYGEIEGATAEESIMLYVTKPGTDESNVLSVDSLVYIEQVKLGGDGTYKFEFPMNDEAGIYNIYVGYGKNDRLIGPVELEVVRQVSGVTGVFNENSQLLTKNEIINSETAVSARGTIDNKFNTEFNAVLYAAGMKENRVLWILSEDKKISEYGNHTLEIDIDKQLILDTDEIKLYLWRENMQPISEMVTGIK